MWQPIEISWTNLFAHKNSKFVFKTNVCTVIFGKNETDVGFENNGSGKSTLFEAISLAITSSTLRGVDKEDFINLDEESSFISFSLENKFLKKTLRIERTFYRKKTGVVEIYENGIKNKELTSINEANSRIFELLGIKKDDLLKYYIIPQDSKYIFFTAPDVEKKEIINRITAGELIKPIVDKIDSDYIDFKAKSDDKKSEVNIYTSRVELLEEQISEHQNSSSNDDRIKELKSEIESLDKDRKLLADELSSKEKQKKIIENKFAKLSSKKTNKVELKKKINDLENELSESKSFLREINNTLESKVTCPHCNKDFLLETEFSSSIKELEQSKTETNCLIETINKRLVTEKEKLQKSRLIESEIESLEEEARLLVKRISKISAELIVKQGENTAFENELNDLLNKNEQDETLLNLQSKLKKNKEKLDLLKSEYKKIESDFEMINFWKFYMGKQGFTTFLANKSIKIIENITNRYLSHFKIDLRVIVNGYKILKNNNVSEKIDVFVSHDNQFTKRFKAESGGEQGRVNLATIIGIQHLINISCHTGGLNLLCLDECFHGVDPLGQENIIKVLEKTNVTSIIITQNVSHNFNSENKIYVKKANGESAYVSEQGF